MRGSGSESIEGQHIEVDESGQDARSDRRKGKKRCDRSEETDSISRQRLRLKDLDSDDAYEQEGRDIKRQIHQIQSKINQTQSQISALESENVGHHDDLEDAFARQRRWEKARRQSASAGPSRPNPVAANTTAAHASTRTAARIATPTTTHAIHTPIPAPFRAARENAGLDDPTEEADEDDELARLADRLLRPNSYSWAVNHPEVMPMLQTIHSAFPHQYTGKKGVSMFTIQERLALWGWWWNELLKESLAAVPNMVVVKMLWQAVRSKITTMPRAIEENKKKR